MALLPPLSNCELTMPSARVGISCSAALLVAAPGAGTAGAAGHTAPQGPHPPQLPAALLPLLFSESLRRSAEGAAGGVPTCTQLALSAPPPPEPAVNLAPEAGPLPPLDEPELLLQRRPVAS